MNGNNPNKTSGLKLSVPFFAGLEEGTLATLIAAHVAKIVFGRRAFASLSAQTWRIPMLDGEIELEFARRRPVSYREVNGGREVRAELDIHGNVIALYVKNGKYGRTMRVDGHMLSQKFKPQSYNL